MKIKLFIASTFLLLVTSSASVSQTISDYLILQNINEYKLDRPEKVFAGEPPIGGPRISDSPGILGAFGHFVLDHTDKSYEVMYIGGNGIPSPAVHVTKHTGSDSDKWLLHEMDIDFRNYFGIPAGSYAVVPVDGNTIMEFGSAGWDYRWISGNKVIQIEYHDPQMAKPEPLEVVKAYLAKHPSTIPAMTLAQLRSAAFKTAWIKDEMDRRLWLCDKWFLQITLNKADEKQVYQESVKSMNIFLDYREKYYSLKAAADEKNLLAGYLSTNNGTGIKTKLKEYKDWWTVNKSASITLP